MKRVVLITALLTGCAGPRQPTILVEGDPPHVGERMASETKKGGRWAWYTAEQLDQIVRDHVRANRVQFDFRGAEPQFWIPRDRRFMSQASYSSGIGRPYLSADIGWDGRVVEHRIGLTVDEVVDETAVPQWPSYLLRGGVKSDRLAAMRTAQVPRPSRSH